MWIFFIEMCIYVVLDVVLVGTEGTHVSRTVKKKEPDLPQMWPKRKRDTLTLLNCDLDIFLHRLYKLEGPIAKVHEAFIFFLNIIYIHIKNVH